MKDLTDRETLFTRGGSFQDPEIEALFDKGLWEEFSRQIRTFSLLTGTAYLSGIISDTLSLGGTPLFYYMMMARVITFTAALLCASTTVRQSGKRHTQKVLLLYFVTITLSECFELLIRPEMAQQEFPLMLIIILCYYLVFPVPYAYSLGGGIGATILYNTILLGVYRIPVQTVFPTITSFILINAMAFFVVTNLNKANRSEAFAVMRLKQTNEELQNEIEERQKVQRKLEELATRDELTNAFNRRHFTYLAKKELLRAERTGQFVNLLFMDIDRFKSVNDQHGHDAGDVVLQKLVELCQNNIRELDIFGRFGGEEFVILLPEIDSIKASLTAHRIRKIIAETPVPTPAGELRITVSIGISSYNKENLETLEKMLKQADIALYRAKENGRNRVEMLETNL